MPGPAFLRGDRVTLAPAEEEDVPFLRENHHDPRVRASRSVHSPAGTDWARQRLGGTMGRNGESLGLLVCVDERPVGFCYLLREQPNAGVFRFAELAYWLAPDEWSNGYATAAGRLLADHAFDELGLHRLTASTFVTNDASRRVLDRLGFTEEGVDRSAAFVDGEWVDEVRYGLLAEEWRTEG
jgi:RimJ/RimL family protein N-acetyltransferase